MREPTASFSVECHTGRTDRVARVVGIGVMLVGFGLGGYPVAVGWYNSAAHPKMREPALGLLLVGWLIFELGRWMNRTCRPSTWHFDADGCSQEGPGSRHRELRWADVEAVRGGAQEVVFRTAISRFRFPLRDIPQADQARVRDWIDRELRASFVYPRPPLSWADNSWMGFRFLLVLSIPLVYQYWFRYMVLPRADEIAGWLLSHPVLLRAIRAFPSELRFLPFIGIALSPVILLFSLAMRLLFTSERKRSWIVRRN